MCKCSICNGDDISITYEGKIRNGAVGTLTEDDYQIFRCNRCGVSWHEIRTYEPQKYYEGTTYRESVNGSSEIAVHYEICDKLALNKIRVMGTEGYRGKVIADIGSAGGVLLDYFKGVAKKTIGIEPSSTQRKELVSKGHEAYDYCQNALKDYREAVDIAVSFDVIEHVEEPQSFVDEIYELLAKGGKVILGTPTDYPLLRKEIGKLFEEFMFDVQHPWIFSEDSLKILFANAGFRNITIIKKQQYGLGNFVSWLVDKKPKGDIQLEWISETMDTAFKEMAIERYGGDYLLVFAEK